MAKSKRMSVETKAKIQTMKALGLSNRKIAKTINFSECAVRKFLKNFEVSGSFSRKPGSGRPRKTTAREDRLLQRLQLKNVFSPSPTIRAQFEEATNVTISDRLVRYRLKEFGLSSYRPAKKPLLTSRMKRQRLDWAKERENWTATDWQNVIFSDESKFNLIGPNGTARVRRRKGQRYSAENVLSTVKHSPYIMVWGCITFAGVGPIIILDGTVNAEKYKEIIREGVVPAIEQLSELRLDPIFQDDSAPCHRARSVSINDQIEKILLSE